MYQSLGCWADTQQWWDGSKRAIPSVEHSNQRLMDDYKQRKDPIGKDMFIWQNFITQRLRLGSKCTTLLVQHIVNFSLSEQEQQRGCGRKQ